MAIFEKIRSYVSFNSSKYIFGAFKNITFMLNKIKKFTFMLNKSIC